MLHHWLLKTLWWLLVLVQWEPKPVHSPNLTQSAPPAYLPTLISHDLTFCSFCSGHTSLLSIQLTNQATPQLRAFISAVPSAQTTHPSEEVLVPCFISRAQFKIIVPPFPTLFYPERRLLRFFLQAFLWVPIKAPGEKPLKEQLLPQFLPPLKGGVWGNTQPCSLMCFLIFSL